jgi:hypothetical protein
MAQGNDTMANAVKATRASLATLKENTAAAGRATERLASEHGLDPQQVRKALAETVAPDELRKHTRRERKKLAKRARRTRKELLREAKIVSREAKRVAQQLRSIGKEAAVNVSAELAERGSEIRHTADRAATRTRRRIGRRRWPWMLGIGAAVGVAAAIAYAVRTRRVSTASPQSAATASDESTESSDNRVDLPAGVSGGSTSGVSDASRHRR